MQPAMDEFKLMCRVCMANEKDEKLVPMFERNDRIAEEIFLICGVRCVYLFNLLKESSNLLKYILGSRNSIALVIPLSSARPVR